MKRQKYKLIYMNIYIIITLKKIALILQIDNIKTSDTFGGGGGEGFSFLEKVGGDTLKI